MQVCLIRTHYYNMIHLHSPIESIGNPVLFVLDVLDLEGKLTESIQPSSLPNIQIGLVKKIPQPTMITHQNKPHANKIIPPHLQRMNDNFHLKIMSRIVLLVLIQFPWLITYHLSFMYQDLTKSSLANISTNQKILIRICSLQDRSICKQMLQLLKASCTLFSAFKIISFSLQICNRIGNL